MNVEFIYPPNSYDVIASAELHGAPSKGDIVTVCDKSYRVNDVEWIIFSDRPYTDRVGVLVNLVESNE